jgi:hypothetical protein
MPALYQEGLAGVALSDDGPRGAGGRGYEEQAGRADQQRTMHGVQAIRESNGPRSIDAQRKGGSHCTARRDRTGTAGSPRTVKG